jgi:hypothetical protein
MAPSPSRKWRLLCTGTNASHYSRAQTSPMKCGKTIVVACGLRQLGSRPCRSACKFTVMRLDYPGLCLDRSGIIEFREELPCPPFNGLLRLK